MEMQLIWCVVPPLLVGLKIMGCGGLHFVGCAAAGARWEARIWESVRTAPEAEKASKWREKEDTEDRNSLLPLKNINIYFFVVVVGFGGTKTRNKQNARPAQHGLTASLACGLHGGLMPGALHRPLLLVALMMGVAGFLPPFPS